MKKILLFPLDMPGYAIKLGVFPLTFTFTELQKHYAIERMNDALSNKEKTLWFYPIVEGGAGSSFGGGVGIKAIDLFHEKYQLGAYYKIHINLDQYAHASFGKDNAFSIFDKPVSYEAITDFQRLTSVDYYGIGNSSSRRNHSQYLINNINGTFQLSIMPVKYFSIAPHVGFSGSDTGKGHGGGHPSIETVFPRSSLVGFDKWIEYFDAGIRIANDTTGNVFQPRKGGTRAFTFDHFQNFGAGSYNYNQYAFDIWQYIPLWNPCITLAIHNGWTFEQASGASQIPFYRLTTLDAWSMLRGFSRGRFRDKSSVIFNVEYYFPISSMLEGIIFYDTGRVFPSVKDFSFNNFKYSAGGGFNAHIFTVMLFGFRAAYGGEGVNIMLSVTKRI